MVNKIGLPENVAEWCLSKSKKYSIWLANQIGDKNCYRVNWFLQTRTESQEQKLLNFSNEVDTILDWKKEVQRPICTKWKWFEKHKCCFRLWRI